MLPQFGLRLELVVVAIPPAVVAAHGVRVAQESHVVPLERAELQHAASLQSQHRAAPERTVGRGGEGGGEEESASVGELPAQHLRKTEIETAMRGGHHVACVDLESSSCTHVGGMGRPAEEEFGAGEMGGAHPVERERGAEIDARTETKEEMGLHVHLRAVHSAFVSAVVAQVVSHTPKLGGEENEGSIVAQSEALVGREMHALEPHHVEAHGGNVGVEREVGGREERVGGRGVVESGGDEAEPEPGVGAVMWSADDAEIELTAILRLVGLRKIANNTPHQSHLSGPTALHAVSLPRALRLRYQRGGRSRVDCRYRFLCSQSACPQAENEQQNASSRIKKPTAHCLSTVCFPASR